MIAQVLAIIWQEKYEKISFGRKIFLELCHTFCERRSLFGFNISHHTASFFGFHPGKDFYCNYLWQCRELCSSLFRRHEFISLYNTIEFIVMDLFQLLQDTFNLG